MSEIINESTSLEDRRAHHVVQAVTEWVLFTNDNLARFRKQAEANDFWQKKCFGQEVWFVNSEKKTKAQAICDWCNEGYSYNNAVSHWNEHVWEECADEKPCGYQDFKRRRLETFMAEHDYG